MNDAILYATLSALVTAVLAAAIWRQYRWRRRPYQLVWGISLSLGTLASLAYAAATATGAAFWFRLYYLCGALWVAPLMGLGSLYLARSRWAPAFAVGLLGLGTVASVSILTAPLDVTALASLTGSGRGILSLPSYGLAILIVLNVLGTLVVAGTAVASALGFVRGRGAPGATLGQLLLASGVLVLGGAGSMAGGGRDAWFWPLMTLGWLVFFAGFALINRVDQRRRDA